MQRKGLLFLFHTWKRPKAIAVAKWLREFSNPMLMICKLDSTA
jgi:hypothetical protein